MNQLASLAGVLGADRYHPSTVALASDPVMKILFVSGWGAVFLACSVIAIALCLSRAPQMTINRRAMVVFAVVFALLGLDHLMSMTTVFVAVYRLKVVVLAVTAAVTVTVAATVVGQVLGIRVDPQEGE